MTNIEIVRLCGRKVKAIFTNGMEFSGDLRVECLGPHRSMTFSVGELKFNKDHVRSIEPLKYRDILRVKEPEIKCGECECGQALGYIISPTETAEQRVCQRCGRVHYVKDEPDLDRLLKHQ